MKKIFLVLAALATMAAVSCVKDEQNPDALVPEPEPEVVYDYSKLVLNELSGAGEDNEKFWELYNTGDVEIDLKGVYINKDEELAWTGAEGVKIPAKGFYAIVGAKGTTPDGFSSGFSAKKSVIVELYAPDGKKLDTFQRGEKGEGAWGDQGLDNNKGSWSRIPDGTGYFQITPNATPGAANNGEGATVDPDLVGNEGAPEAPAKVAKVVFNELCGNKVEYDTFESANKFIELYNAGDAEGSLEGWTIRKYAADATDVEGKYNVCWTAPAGTKLAAGAYLVLGADQTDPALGFDAGLSAKKGLKVELVDADGNVVDKFVRGADVDPFGEEPLAENKEASFSRVPNGTGEWAYAAPTPGAANGEKTGEIEHK